jgi:hypothetical protein
MATPLGMVTVALTLGVAAWMRWTKSGQAAVTYYQGAFMRLGEVISQVWGGVVDALMAGDLELAGQVAIGGLMVLWHEATQDVVTLWADVKWGFIQAWTEAGAAFTSVMIDAVSGVQAAFTVAVSGMMSAWTELAKHAALSMATIQTMATAAFFTGQVATGRMTQEAATGMLSATRRAIAKQALAGMGQNAAKQADIAANKDKNLRAIGAARNGAQYGVAVGRNAATEANAAAWQKTIDDKRRAVEEARTELEKANAKAALARAKREADFAINPDGVGNDASKVSAISAGTFSAAGALAAFGGSQGGGVAQRTLEEMQAVRRILAEVKKTADREWNQRKNDEAKMNIRFATGTV